MVRKHERFELLQVTLGGQAIGNATVDAWDDNEGRSQWIARVLIDIARHEHEGLLTGLTRSGAHVRGNVTVERGQVGPRGRAMQIVELHGRGPLTRELPADPT